MSVNEIALNIIGAGAKQAIAAYYLLAAMLDNTSSMSFADVILQSNLGIMTWIVDSSYKVIMFAS